MKYLLVKMRRDLLHMWTQFFSVFLMAFLGVLIYAGMEGTWFGMQNEISRFYGDTNLASAWIYGNGLSSSDLQGINNLDNVTGCTLSMKATVKMKTDSSDDIEPAISLTAYDDDSISRTTAQSGEAFSKDAEGLWLDSRFADKHKIKAGDSITIEAGQAQKTLTVKGLILSSDNTYFTGSSADLMPNHEKYGYAFTNEKTAKSIFGGIIYNEMRVKIADGASTADLQTNAQNLLGDRYLGFANRDTLNSVYAPLDKAEQIKKMSIMFSSIFILLALLTMQTAMTRLVANQRTQIGTMKALGFKSGQIKLHYTLYGLTVGLLGGIAGLLLAPVTITPIIFMMITKIYALPKYAGMLSPVSYALVAFVALCCTLSTLFACRKGIHGMPAETMRGAAPRDGRQVLLEKAPAIWNKLPFGWKWSLRDISRSKVRSIMGIIGVLGCMMLLTASFGIQNSIDHSNDYTYKTQYTYGAKISLSPAATAQNRDDLLKETGKGQWVQETAIEIKDMRDKNNRVLSAADDGDYIQYQSTDGAFEKLPGSGVFVSQKTANLLNIKKGDTIYFRLLSEKDYTKATVADIISAMSPQGIFISKEAWQNLVENFTPTSLLVGDSGVKDKVERLSYVQSATTIGSQYSSTEEALQTLSTVFTLLKLAAILLGVVILYNLGILSYTERLREYATLKVLGFYQREIRSFALRENLVTTVIGWLIGIPAGFLFLSAYVATVSTYNVDWHPNLTALSFIISTLITIGCSFGVNLTLSFKVKKIDMVEALKSVE
jgi:putative ABC transport system permease protein